jgi:hypothetical protein
MTTPTENENITKPTLRRLTREEAPGVIDAWRSSGLSAAAFGATIDISGQNIYQWASDFRKEKRRQAANENNGTLQRVQLAESVSLVATAAPISIIMETPPRVLVSADVDEMHLRSVLRALSL